MKSMLLLAKLAVLFLVVGMPSCSKESDGPNAARENPDKKKRADFKTEDADPSEERKQPVSKSGDRTPTETERRIRGVTQQIDQIEVERKQLSIVEHERRVSLNKLRGVPDHTPIDISNPNVAVGSAIEGEVEAFDAYLMVALQLQTLEVKEKLATEQLQRALKREDGAPEDRKLRGSETK